jgi:FMN phosphatase YigB (HAD superfamily)
MVGDRIIDDVSGAMNVGMHGIWRKTNYPWPKPETITPTAVINNLSELLLILDNLA